jgi:signal transduction histidine kinase
LEVKIGSLSKKWLIRLEFRRFMKKLLVLLFLLFSMGGFGQNPQLDSLKMVVKKLYNQPASVERDSLITVSICNIYSLNLYSTQTLVDSLHKFSATSKWAQTAAYDHYVTALSYARTGFSKLAFTEYEIALNLSKKYDDNIIYAKATQKLVVLISNILIKKQIEDKTIKEKYLKYLFDGLKIANSVKDPYLISNAYVGIGLYYLNQKKYKEASKCYKNASEVVKNDTEKYFYCYQNGIWAEALCKLYLKKEVEGFKVINQVKTICQTQRKDGQDKYLLCVMSIFLGNYYIEKKQYENALIEAKTGEIAYKSIKFYYLENFLNKIFYKSYKELNNPTKALMYYEKIQAFEQDEQTRESDGQFKEFQLKYEDEKQKTQIQTLENQKLTQTRNVLSFVGLLALSIIGYVFWNNQKLKKKNAEIEQALFKGQTIERKRVAEELHDNLSAKISGIRWRLEAITPHFEAEKEQKIYDSSVNALAEVYTDVRLIAHNLLPAELETKGLVFALQHLIKELNGLDKTKFSLQIPDNLGRFKNKIEYEIFSIILELSNNILKHSQAQNATISLEKINQKLSLTVADNGIGFGENKDKKGMGMDNLKSRVLTLNGMLKIENNVGVKVEIEVPV